MEKEDLGLSDTAEVAREVQQCGRSAGRVECREGSSRHQGAILSLLLLTAIIPSSTAPPQSHDLSTLRGSTPETRALPKMTVWRMW